MNDLLTQLPTDENPITYNEKKILETVFGKSTTSVSFEVKDYIISAILFAVLSLQPVDSLIKSVIKTNSEYIILGIKTLIFIILYFFIRNISLIRKSR